MSTISTLKQIIPTLSGAEKRNFVLFAGLNQGEKAYLALYQLLLTPKLDHAQLIQNFKETSNNADFNATCTYLYKVLMRSLVNFHQQSSVENKLLTGISEIKILFKKGLNREGFEEIETLRQFAVENEKFLYCAILDKMNLHYNVRFQFHTVSETSLILLQNHLRTNISKEQNSSDHSALYELLYHRYLINGTVRSLKEKEKLNDLVFTEMNLAGNPRFQSFDLKRNHLLFQSVYFMMTADYKSSLATFYDLNNLFEENKHLWNDPPILYINNLRGILNNLYQTGQFYEMEFFIDKLRKLYQNKPLPTLFQIIYVADLKMNIGLNQYQKSFEIMNENKLFAFHQLTLTDYAEAQLYSSITCFYQKQFKQAATMIRKILSVENIKTNPHYHIIKLINLLILFELHDFEYLQSETRSFERDLKKAHKYFETEIILIRFLKKHPNLITKTAQKEHLTKTIAELTIISGTDYEKQLFHIIDLISWLKTKLPKYL